MDDNTIRRAFQIALANGLAMFGVEIDPADDTSATSASFIASISVGGAKFEAVLSIGVSTEAACYLVERMLGENTTDETVVADGLGEIANLAAGGVKTQTADGTVSIGLPSVVTGEKLRASHASNGLTGDFCVRVDGHHPMVCGYYVQESNTEESKGDMVFEQKQS